MCIVYKFMAASSVTYNINVINDPSYNIDGTFKKNIRFMDENMNVEYKTISSTDIPLLNQLKPDAMYIKTLIDNIQKHEINKKDVDIIHSNIKEQIVHKLNENNIDEIIVATMFKKYFFQYLTCFYNTTDTSTKVNKLYFGVTDDGLLLGIPIKNIENIKQIIINNITNPEKININSHNSELIHDFIKQTQINLIEIPTDVHDTYTEYIYDSKKENIHYPINSIIHILKKYKKKEHKMNKNRQSLLNIREYIHSRFHLSITSGSPIISSLSDDYHDKLDINEIKQYLNNLIFYFILGMKDDLRNEITYQDIYAIGVYGKNKNNINIVINYDKIIEIIINFFTTRVSDEIQQKASIDYYISKINHIKNLNFSSILNNKNDFISMIDVVYQHYMTKIDSIIKKHAEINFTAMYDTIKYNRFESFYNILKSTGEYKFYIIEFIFPAPNRSRSSSEISNNKISIKEIVKEKVKINVEPPSSSSSSSSSSSKPITKEEIRDVEKDVIYIRRFASNNNISCVKSIKQKKYKLTND